MFCFIRSKGLRGFLFRFLFYFSFVLVVFSRRSWRNHVQFFASWLYRSIKIDLSSMAAAAGLELASQQKGSKFLIFTAFLLVSHTFEVVKKGRKKERKKKKKKKKLGRLLAATKGGSAFLARPNLANIITQHTPFRLNHLGKLNFLFVCVCVSLRLPLSDCFSLAGKKRGLKHTHSSHSTSLGLWGRVIRAVFFFLGSSSESYTRMNFLPTTISRYITRETTTTTKKKILMA